MKKVKDEERKEIHGGHSVVAWGNHESNRPGVAGWEQTCPKTGHTTVHIYDRTVYYYRKGSGRKYCCPKKGCN